MGFDDDFEAVVVPCMMTAYGVAATYHPQDGSTDVALTAVIESRTGDAPEEMDGRTTQRERREISISNDPASEYGGVATPSDRATITMEGSEWAVEAVLEYAPPLHRLRLVRIGTSEVAADGYRRRR